MSTWVMPSSPKPESPSPSFSRAASFSSPIHSNLKRIAPEVIQLRIEGAYVDGEPFLARLAVNHAGLHTSRRHVYLDTTEDARRPRWKLDVRHRPLDFFLIRCDRYCSRKGATAAETPAGPRHESSRELSQ